MRKTNLSRSRAETKSGGGGIEERLYQKEEEGGVDGTNEIIFFAVWYYAEKRYEKKPDEKQQVFQYYFTKNLKIMICRQTTCNNIPNKPFDPSCLLDFRIHLLPLANNDINIRMMHAMIGNELSNRWEYRLRRHLMPVFPGNKYTPSFYTWG